ncbi:MAG: SufB/SufD family protein [Halanaerobiaceae bacterium]
MKTVITNYSQEFEGLIDAYEKSGGDGDVFKNSENAFLLINADKVIGANEVEGLEIETEEIENGIKVNITVKKGAKLKKPMHVCFGVTHKEGIQHIVSDYLLEEGAEAHLLAHCSFPKAEEVVHKMDAVIRLEKDAVLSYNEVHYHGPDAGIEVLPRTRAELGENAYFYNEFKLVKGLVGKLDLDYEVDLGENAVTELISKVYGKKDDNIRIKETFNLNGKGSRGIAKTRIFAADDTVSEVIGEAYGNAPYVKGHIDCVEVVKGNAEVSAIPIIKVKDEMAELTHEASIGRINKKQLDTLIARGLSEDEATDLIVNGMLK